LDREANRTLHYRGTLYIVAVYGFFASFFIILGTPFLRAWMGEEFAAQSAGVLGILALGGLFNAMARPAITALQGIGKPHIPVLLHATELVWYLPLVYVLVKAFGITGAAWAWCLRVLVDTSLLHVASCMELEERAGAYVRLLKAAAGPMIVCSAAFTAVWVCGLPLNAPAAAGAITLTCAVYALLVWWKVMDARTKDTLAALWGRW
jgi:O-antigen/teichoic acid export membrane protein